MRYDHYVRRLQAAFTEIGMKRRQIVRHNQALTNLNLMENDQFDSSQMRQTQFMTVKYADPNVVEEMLEKYNQVLGKSGGDNDVSEVLDKSFDPNDPIEGLQYQLQREYEKYNKAMSKKSKEIQSALENDAKRFKILQSLTEREEKIKELQGRLEEEKRKRKAAKKKQSEQKMEQIRENERKYQEKKREEKEKQEEKMRKLKEKLREEEEKRKEQMEEKEKKLKEQHERVLLKKNKSEQAFREAMNQTFNHILSQQHEHSRRHQELITTRTEKLHQKTGHEEGKRKEFYRMKESLEEEKFQSLMSKLSMKEEHARWMQLQKAQEEKKRRKDLRQKQQKFQHLKGSLDDVQQLRLQELNDKFKKIHDNNQRRKQLQDEKMMLRKEMHALKQQDLHQSFLRQERQKNSKFRKLIQDNYQYKERAEMKQLQEMMVKSAQQQFQKQRRMEDLQLEQSMVAVSESLIKKSKSCKLRKKKEVEYLQSFLEKCGSPTRLSEYGIGVEEEKKKPEVGEQAK